MSKPHEARIDRSIIVPFIIFTLIWGSTWLVIRGQIGTVAPQWSVTYRFAIAAIAMAAVAQWKGQSLRPNPPMLIAATILGVSQFCINFNCVYVAERYITSGIVATVFAILIVPNSLLGWALLGQRPSGRFAIGGVIAVAGIGLLFLHELQSSSATSGEVLTGLGLTLFGMLGASWANVYQARDSVKRYPLLALLAWAMGIGAVADALFALAIAGAPTIDTSPAYWAGLTYLALAATVLAFSLYLPVVRKIGPGRAAYSSVLVPVIAMGLSTIFENYQWSLLAGAGGLLALGGMLVALSGSRGSKIAAPDAA
ncbi:EamA family transporter [Sphingomonas sp.]|uniref:DMT family transporter n=1 Tax=Sphingomonas sp. TaxID=28214 RepID=UPI00286BF0E0|nr:EamA family transporter [Sphingomonas sp.]